MNLKIKEIQEDETNNFEQNLIKSPSYDLPKLIICNSESKNSTRFDSISRKSPKRVTFKRNVTVVNIESHKKYLKKQNHLEALSLFDDEDFNDENSHNCINCKIF